MIRHPRPIHLLAVLLIAAMAILTRASVSAQANQRYVTGHWLAEYWENTEHVGPAFSSGFAEAIDFRWGLNRPLDGQDTFSVRWTRSEYFSSGVYRFVATMDDGMRIWVDDMLIIDSWNESVEHTISKDVPLSEGWHHMRVDYHDLGGVATAVLNWTPISGGNTYPNWRGEYFSNPYLGGSPSFVRDDRYLDFNWGFGAPDLRLPADNFSARWTRTFYGVPGQYRLDLTSDDGGRLYVNDQLVIDSWGVQASKTRSVDYWFSGPANLRVEYFEAEGMASVRVDIVSVNGGEGILPPTPVPTPAPPTGPTVNCPVSPTPTYGVIISLRPLNVRAGPGLTTAILGQLQSCAQPMVTGNRSADGQWVEILTGGGSIGWVLNQFISTVDDLPVGSG